MKMRDLPFAGPSSEILSKVNEEECPEINEQHCRRENTTNDGNSICLDLVENFKSHTKRECALAGNEDSQQLSRITIVTIKASLGEIPQF
jgi:hypothetical protein